MKTAFLVLKNSGYVHTAFYYYWRTQEWEDDFISNSFRLAVKKKNDKFK